MAGAVSYPYLAPALPGLGPEPPAPVSRTQDPREALTELYGFGAFRPGQEEAVRAAVQGRDVLVVMPTGSGKSLCYQLPALMRADLTVVVSPLVSLMTDQVEALERIAPRRVGLINGQQDAGANRRVLEAAAGGRLRLLYVAPERFASPGFLERLSRTRVGLFVVDEAHCVSQWGHDFRPDYFRLADAARWLGAEAIVASTATATPRVAADIAERLGLRDPVRISTGFDRPNLSFAVVPAASKEAAQGAIAQVLADPAARPAIVYAGTRADCDRLAGRLAHELELPVVTYHAGLSRRDRTEAQRRFMAGDVPVVVATNAFGMGVDKPDVRTVVHAAVPGSIEAYYQEAGRAGRDGRPARALLFSSDKDKGLHVFFMQRADLRDDLLTSVARRLTEDDRYDVAVRDLAREPGDEDGIRSAVGYLAQAGVLQPTPAPPDRLLGRVVGSWDAAAAASCRTAAAEAAAVRRRQFRAVWQWVEGDSCRRLGMLRHFGDTSSPAPTAGCCDVCDPRLRPRAIASVPRRGARRPAQLAHRPSTAADDDGLDDAILDVVATAEPPMGRVRAVDVLRGSRSKAISANSYDGLPHYGRFRHLSAFSVLERVDALLAAGALKSTPGRFPKLVVA
ncbi:MAG: ATP-dependent DNA helicase RecQ [uncultured Solirubrobacteraceae bacterium]|uniref:ATP-dependent DNA helicase RecQ n=1 Tax=uncultured Solirubrobacteraceae bacterium TaxID=1162706 RepID=A0A6J4R677_9ACTN|nr:MAG: ATP-dependent DNA helicase RecQ [uncultured Solirubrobacteraceae bacterium]